MVAVSTPKPQYINELYQSDPYAAPDAGDGRYASRNFAGAANGVQVVLATKATDGFTIQDSAGNDSFNLTNVNGPTTDVILSGGHDVVTFGAGNQYVLSASLASGAQEFTTLVFEAGVSATQGALTHGFSNMYFGTGFGSDQAAGFTVRFHGYGAGAHLVYDRAGDFGAPAGYYHVENESGVWLTGKFEALQGLTPDHYLFT